jgi:hypothetical protein
MLDFSSMYNSYPTNQLSDAEIDQHRLNAVKEIMQIPLPALPNGKV